MKNILMRPMLYRDILMLLRETEPGQEERHLLTAKTRFKHGPAYTFLDGEIVGACAGVTIYWPGMGEVWLVTSRIWTRYPREIVVWTRKVLDSTLDLSQKDSCGVMTCWAVIAFAMHVSGKERVYESRRSSTDRIGKVQRGNGP